MPNFNFKKVPSWLFVVFSLLVFFIISLFCFSGIWPNYFIPSSAERTNDRYYLQPGLSHADPLTTKKPALRDILAGPLITSADPAWGDPAAPLAIVEFADFTCDYCNQQEQSIRTVINKYQDQVLFVWKDYPEDLRKFRLQ